MARRPARAGYALASLVACFCLNTGIDEVKAQGPAPAQPTASLNSNPVQGERLSDWLLRKPQDSDAFAFGLSWRVPREQTTQSFLQNELLLQMHLTKAANPREHYALARLISGLGTSGLIPIPVPDARWLQAHPKADPVLQADQRVALPKRAQTISMLRLDATVCTVPHRPGRRPVDYLKMCEPAQWRRIDRAWVIQPNGEIKDYGVASWNTQAQDELAPGALLWAPTRGSGWSEAASMLMAQFLATQDYSTIVSLKNGPQVSQWTQGAQMDLPWLNADPFTAAGQPPRDAIWTSNNLGMIGLMQTPSARFAKAGEVRFNLSRIYPYLRYNVFAQPFDSLEVGFRYTDIKNRAYGEAALSGDQTYKDKSIDFLVRLIEETAHLPQVALGMIDFGGTGLFSSEFVVANKRFGNLDWSLGVGWGNMGSSGNIGNPFSLITKRFDTRGGTSAQGGSPNTAAYFRGPAALFGGLQYHTPWPNWVLKAEYEGNNYQRQPLSNNQSQRTPLNVGLVHRYHPALDISLGVERGNAIMLGFTLHTSVAKLHAPKVSDPPTPGIVYERPTAEPVWLGTAADVSAMSGWAVREISRLGNALHVHLDGAGGVHWNERI